MDDGNGGRPDIVSDHPHARLEDLTPGARIQGLLVNTVVTVGAAPTLHTAHKGIERQHVWLGVAVPGDTVGNFGSALEVLSQRATYLYMDEARYWYDTQASVTRTAQDHADRLREHPEEAWAELVSRLGRERAARDAFAAVQVCPDDSGSVPDTEEAKLVVLHPQHTHTKGNTDSAALRFARTCLDTRGSAQRTNRNTVVFLAPDGKRMEELEAATRDFLAWRYICQRTVELNLTEQQKSMAERRRKAADDTIDLRIATAYIWALVPDQPDPARPSEWQILKAEGSQARLADRVAVKLRQGDLLATAYSPQRVRMSLDGPLKSAWARGHISVGELWMYHCRYPYLARLRDRRVLDDAVRSVLQQVTWDAEGFALAESFDETTGRYQGLAIPHEATFGGIADSTLLVQPSVAHEQWDKDRLPSTPPSPGDGEEFTTDVEMKPGGDTAVIDRGSSGVAPPPPPPAPEPKNVRFFGSVKLNPERYGRDMTKVAQEILQHLAAVDGADLQVRVEISAEKQDGFPDDKVRIVTENARTLKFESFGFEGD